MSPAEPVAAHMLDFVSHSAAQTHRLGVRLGRLLHPGDVLLLTGEFGAGKTTFIQGVAEGLGVAEPVTSPSFILVWEYRAGDDQAGDDRAGDDRGEIPFYHIDLYRIESLDEALEIGLEDYLYGEGICAVEWADRVPAAMPEEHLRIALSFLSETKRVVRMEPAGPRYIALVEAFKRRAFG